MANGDQLTAEQFAAKIRAKYPGAYDHLQDQELTAKVLKKYPEYGEKVMAPGVAEARKQVSGPITRMIKEVDAKPDTAYSIFQPTGVSTKPRGGQFGGTPEQVEKVRGIQKNVTETTMSMVGGLPGTGIKGVAGVAARVAGTGLGGAAGSLAGAHESKSDFWDAAKTGALFSGGQLILGEFLPAGMKALSRLWKADPQAVAEAGDLISTEERTRQVVQSKASELRKAANASYPELPDIPIMPAARTAQAAEASAARSSVEGLPKQVGKLADIGRQRQREALALLTKAQRVLQQQGATPEVLQILEKARKAGTMPAMDAQQVKSALGRLLSKGNLPGPQYQATKEAYEAMVGSIKQVATDAGQLPAYEAAEQRVAQWHADFDNPGAPLKPIMDASADERGVVLKHLLSDPETRVRATAALQRNGFNVEEINRLATKYRSPTDLNHAIENAARIEQIGEKSFSAQEAEATRKALGNKALKTGAKLGGAYLLYDLYKELKGKNPSLFP